MYTPKLFSLFEPLIEIKEQTLTSFAQVTKVITCTLIETLSYVESSNYTWSPNVVVIHPFTNDIKNMGPQQFLEKFEIIQ